MDELYRLYDGTWIILKNVSRIEQIRNEAAALVVVGDRHIYLKFEGPTGFKDALAYDDALALAINEAKRSTSKPMGNEGTTS